MASSLGREVGAVPGQVGSSSAAGTNSLLRDGAQVVRDADDVLDSLLGPGHEAQRREPADRTEKLIPSWRPCWPRSRPAPLAGRGRGSGLDADAAGAALVRLELQGLVRSDSAGASAPPSTRARL